MLFKTNTTYLIHIQKEKKKREKKEKKKKKKTKKKGREKKLNFPRKILKMDQDNMREPQSIHFLFMLHFKDLICINSKGTPK